MFKSLKNITMITLAVGSLAACMPPQTNSAVYSNTQSMQAQSVNFGTITDVRMVETRNISQGDQLIGGVIGGLAGAVLGDQFGNGNGNTIMTGAGAIAGAAIGQNVATNANRHQAQQWFVSMNNGSTITVIQADPSLFVGANVKVIFDGNTTRLVL